MTRPARILLVEDDPNLRRVLAYHLEKAGFDLSVAGDGGAALERLSAEPCDLVLTDVRMPGMDGRELLLAVRERDPDLPVVVMTAYGTIQDAVEAMKAGAADYVTKPVEREALLLTVEKALRVSGLARENRRLRETLAEKHPLDAMVGSSRALQDLLRSIRRIGPSDATVLIAGESGSGKELVARALHALSPRAGGPFVAINCAAMPRDLLESELFGHEKGAFTGAFEARPGRFVQAEGGTLLLDEIGEMDLPLQAKILRVLQERVVDPVGGRSARPVDVRVLAATNRDLQAAVKSGMFREDLFWRLHVIPLRVPPLRERLEDLPLLFARFYGRYSGRSADLDPRSLELMTRYPWPGNVRELQSLCQRLAVLHPGQPVTPELLPEEVRGGGAERGMAPGGLWAVERDAIVKALTESNGNRSAAARALQIPRHILLYRMKKFGIL